MLVIGLYTAFTCYERWGMDCASFNPDRESLVERSLDDLDFTNFSHGVHKCPGSKIAIMVSIVATCHLFASVSE